MFMHPAIRSACGALLLALAFASSDVVRAEESTASSVASVDLLPPEQDVSETVIERGDIEAALAASAHVVSGTWQTQRIEHLFLEPEASLAVPLEDGRLHLYSQGQGVFEDRKAVAGVLGEPVDFADKPVNAALDGRSASI